MKYSIHWLSSQLFALFLCVVALQTKAQYAPFVGANSIVMSTFLADRQVYDTLTAVLADQSFSVTGVEKRLLIRSKRNIAFSPKGLIFEGQIKITAGIIELTGRLVESTTDENLPLSTAGIPVIFAKDRNSAQRLAFSYMDTLAKYLQSALKSTRTYKYQSTTI